MRHDDDLDDFSHLPTVDAEPSSEGAQDLWQKRAPAHATPEPQHSEQEELLEEQLLHHELPEEPAYAEDQHYSHAPEWAEETYVEEPAAIDEEAAPPMPEPTQAPDWIREAFGGEVPETAPAALAAGMPMLIKAELPDAPPPVFTNPTGKVVAAPPPPEPEKKPKIQIKIQPALAPVRPPPVQFEEPDVDASHESFHEEPENQDHEHESEPEIHTPAAPPADGEIEAPPADNTPDMLTARKRAIITAVLVHLGLVLLLAIIHNVPLDFKRPEIVALTNVENVDNPDWKKVTSAMPQTSSMASISPITSTGISNIAMPQVDFSATANELNMGTSFGSFGAGAGMGGKVSFLGNTGSGRNICFVVDVSASMSALGGSGSGKRISRFELLKKELVKSLSKMPTGTQFQIIYFSDFAWAHNEVDSKKSREFEGARWTITPDNTNVSIPRFRYVSASMATLRKSREIIEDSDNPGGTNWGSGLFMALAASPKPDVIFFMTDGNRSDAEGWIDAVTRYNARGKKTVIHTTAMMEPDAAEELDQLAKRNGGKFTVVKSDGTIIKGEDYFKPSSQ